MFWFIAGVMSLLALAFVLPPLWRQQAPSDALDADARRLRALDEAHASGVLSDDEYHAKRAALSTVQPPAAPPQSPPWGTVVVLALTIPLGAWLLYGKLGEPDALDPQALTTPRPGPHDAASGAPQDMEQAVAGLAARLRAEPDNLDGWLLLARAYKAMERFEPARAAVAQAYRLAPDDPDVVIEYAEASALATPGRRFESDSIQLLERAMSMEPQHQRGMWLLGIAAMQSGDPAAAISHWERLQALLADDAEALDSLQQQIDGARQMLDAGSQSPMLAAPSTPATPAAPAADIDTDAPSGARLTVQVDIDPALRASLGATDVLFVYARAPEGSRMPLAIQRIPAASLPATVVLDDSTSMMPQLKLSSLAEVIVGARISRTGQATPAPGDLEAQSDPVAVTRTQPLRLLINRIVE
jgi:cytochrome c-type biogenesis protein CcmH